MPAVTATAALAAGDGETSLPPFNGDDEEAFLLSEGSGAFLSNGDDGAFLFNGDCEAAFFSGDDGGGWVFVKGGVAVSSLERSAKRKLLTSSTPSTCTLYHPTFLLTTVPVGPGCVRGGEDQRPIRGARPREEERPEQRNGIGGRQEGGGS